VLYLKKGECLKMEFDLREQRKYIYAAISLACAIIFTMIVWQYKKWTATWFGVPVVFIAIPACLLLAYGLSRLEWWQSRYYSSTPRVLLILIGGIILSTFLGVYYTEPRVEDAWTSGHVYSYQESRAGGWYYYNFASVNSGNSSSSSSSSPDIDMDNMDGEAVLVIFLIVLVIIIVLASAFIPHFWVFGGALLITALLMVAYREFILEESRYRRYQY
jgi:hypothetical protein